MALENNRRIAIARQADEQARLHGKSHEGQLLSQILRGRIRSLRLVGERYETGPRRHTALRPKYSGGHRSPRPRTVARPALPPPPARAVAEARPEQLLSGRREHRTAGLHGGQDTLRLPHGPYRRRAGRPQRMPDRRGGHRRNRPGILDLRPNARTPQIRRRLQGGSGGVSADGEQCRGGRHEVAQRPDEGTGTAQPGGTAVTAGRQRCPALPDESLSDGRTAARQRHRSVRIVRRRNRPGRSWNRHHGPARIHHAVQAGRAETTGAAFHPKRLSAVGRSSGRL